MIKNHRFSLPKWSSLVTFGVTTAIFGFSCGSGSSPAPTAPLVRQPQVRYADAVCGDAIFGLGRPVSQSALANAGRMGFSLREVHFRNVVLKNTDAAEIEFAYRMKLELVEQSSPRGAYLVPEYSIPCQETNRLSPRARRLSRTMIPIVSDLHLPNLRITASTEPYSVPRIGEMTFSLENKYFSFNNQNWGRYANVRTLAQYMDILRQRSLFDAVELREMADGWLGIVAEKRTGIEKSQLVILLSRSY